MPITNEASRVAQTLRRGTAAAHHALDHHPLMQQLLAGGLTRELYVQSLVAMVLPHAWLERQVLDSPHHSATGLGLSPRLGLLEADLLALGGRVPPVPVPAPDPGESRAAWWGRVYVLEGSRMGSAVIARRLRSVLGEDLPCRFFGDEVAAEEQAALVAKRDQALASNEDLELALASARAAFAAYSAGLDALPAGPAPARAPGNDASPGESPELEAALAACSKEPVHIPGAIQPHGALVAMDEQMSRVDQVSGNLEQVLGIAVAAALAMTPEQLFTTRWMDQIRRQLGAAHRHGALVISLRIRGQSRRFRLLPYRSGSRVVVEIEPISGHPERFLFGALAEWQSTLSRHASRDGLLDALARLVRDLASYERVMVYRFDEDWNGSVVAESLAEGATSYAGHHFPASDIPAQVRHIYHVMRVRDIPDATAAAVPLVTASVRVDESPLDLSPGMLRAVAPIHVRYLANMGVVASMSIALHLEGRLWGLLACHCTRPNVLSPALRDALAALVQTASIQLELIQAREEAMLVHRANDSRDILVDEQGEFADPGHIVERHGPAWLKLFQAGGAVLVAGERTASVGDTPEMASVHAIVDWLGQHHAGELAWSSRELGTTGVAELCNPAVAAGLLAVPLPIHHPRPAWLLFFRPEKAESRIWAGKPEKVVDRESGKLSPRRSFTSWEETVRGQSIPWAAVEQRSAADLANDLAVLIAAGEIGRLNKRLEHLASSDHLTGLWNRYRMEEAIGHEVSVAERYNRPCALVMFDLDHFKRLNDTHGHDAGDEVLVQVSRAVSSQLRDTDHVSRWGGEEFIVLAADTGLEGAGRLAERLRSSIESLVVRDYGTITASFGIAAHRKGELGRDTIKRADVAMYAAKQNGRNRVEASAD